MTDGTGAAITYTIWAAACSATGIQLIDPGPTLPAADQTDGGAIDQYHLTNGRNVAIITYDLVAAATVRPRQLLANTATLVQLRGQRSRAGPYHGGPDRHRQLSPSPSR